MRTEKKTSLFGIKALHESSTFIVGMRKSRYNTAGGRFEAVHKSPELWPRLKTTLRALLIEVLNILIGVQNIPLPACANAIYKYIYIYIFNSFSIASTCALRVEGCAEVCARFHRAEVG